MNEFQPGSYKVLYVYQINDGKHEGRLKVGDATYHTTKTLDEIQEEANANYPFRNAGFPWSTSEIEAAARKRIDEQTKTADVDYTLVWSILAVKPDLEVPGRYLSYRDYEVHSVLMRSGFGKSFARNDKKSGEWFEASIDDVKNAVTALISGNDSISNTNSSSLKITLRDEQKAAVKETLKVFRKGSIDDPKDFLWNAIMRFGKTLTTYALVKELDDVSKVLIMTHRPVVLDGWYEDFGKSFDSDSEWRFGSKKKGDSWDKVKTAKKFFYFASIQDLRGSFADESELEGIEGEDLTNALFAKNSELFGTDFDLVVLDESHEGTQTGLAELVNSNLRAKYKLHLSGTPFNIIDGFEGGEVYSWSYTDEQKASEDWDHKYSEWLVNPSAEYPGDVNPYGKLPRMEIRNLWINDLFKTHAAVDPTTTQFNFAKFFEVDRSKLTAGKVYDDFHQFTNVAAIDELLNHMTQNDEHGALEVETGEAKVDHRNWPFSRDNSKRDFAHTFWVVPTVEAAVSLHERLNVHPGFSDFAVVNATGDNDGGDALAAVKKAIKENDRTITLSVGKLTTGTTVPEWTAVFMLSNMRSPMLYMQTIFRVKSSGSLADGRQKDVGYVFDFAPDRSLEMISQSVAKTASRRPGYADLTLAEKDEVEREEMEEMLKYLPVISYEGNRFIKADTSKLMQTLHKVYIGRAVDSGFYDPKLFKFDFHGITPEQMEFANKMVEIIGKSSKDSSVKKMTISESRLSEADKKVLDKGKPERNAPQSEKDEWDEKAQRLSHDRKNGKKIVQLLRGVSARIPMLVFATDVEQTVTLDNLPEIIDDESWKEFMPKGFDKEAWEKLKEFFNRPVFEGACEEIRDRVRRIYELPIIPRVAGIAHLFSTFRNPDKETVLTPWSVVNRQVSSTLGGLRFVDDDGKWFTKSSLEDKTEDSHTWNEIEDSNGEIELSPRWTEVDKDLQEFWEDNYTTVLDINSKTSLYPLYIAASLWYRIREEYHAEFDKIDLKIDEEILKEVIENQIFVNCRVSYSKTIAQRVLSGYAGWNVTTSVVDVRDIRRKLIDTKVTKEDQKAVWKWLFNPKNLHTATERANEVLTSENLEEIVALAKACAENEDRFAAVVSNPPYHIDLGGKSHQIYADFYMISRNLCRFMSMIFPLGWQTSTGKASGSASHPRMRSDSSLVSVDNYYETTESPTHVFPGIGTGGVSIIWRDADSDNKGLVDFKEYGCLVEKRNLEKIEYWGIRTNEIFSKISNWMDNLKLKSMVETVSGRNPHGILGFYTTDPEREQFSLLSRDPGESTVKFWSKEIGSAKYGWFYISRKTEGLKLSKEDKWKLAWPITGSYASYRNAFILKPGELVSDTFIIKNFDVEKHALNFKSYFSTLFYRFVVSESSTSHHATRKVNSFCPDLSGAINPRTSLIGWESDWTDEDLKKLFEDVLTEEDWQYIEKVAIESDPVGAKR